MLRRMVLLCALLGGFAMNTAAAQEAPPPKAESNTLSVSGSGDAKANPDVAYVTLGVVAQGKRAQEAAKANAASTQKVMEALKTMGIADKDIQTANYSVQPLYENRPNREPVIVGYQVSNQVQATIRKLDTVGSLIDAALDAGANNVQGVSFGLEARAKPESEALQEAVKDARRKADVLAKAAGVRIIGVLRIQEGASFRPVPMAEMAVLRAGVGGAPTPISPGELTVHANVTIVYTIAPEPNR
jgi:uncharacterized protein YggE